MGRSYSLHITLDMSVDNESVKKLMDQGAKIGIRYISSKDPENEYSHNFLTTKHATEMIIARTQNSFGKPFPIVKGNNINANLITYVFGKNLYILFAPLGREVVKHSENDCSLDFAPYLLLLLDMCKDFSIKNFHTIDDYHDDLKIMYYEDQEKETLCKRDNSIRITLDLAYNLMSNFAAEAYGRDIHYFAYDDIECHHELALRDVRERVEEIYQQPPTLRKVFHHKPDFIIKKDDLQCYAFFGVTPQEPCPVIVLKPCKYIQYKHGFVDFDPYFRLMLEWCSPYLILEIATCYGIDNISTLLHFYFIKIFLALKKFVRCSIMRKNI